MAIWTINERCEESSISLDHPAVPPSLYSRDSPSSPRLEISEMDSAPFSQNFADLFEGQGLQLPAEPAPKWKTIINPDMSYDIENITNIKDIDPSWQYDEIEEIVVMSSKRLSALPTIREEISEIKARVPTATLSDFAFEISDLMPKTYRSTTSQLCVRRDTGTKHIIKRRRAVVGSSWLEQTILEALAKLSGPFLSTSRCVFYEREYIYIVLDHHPGGSLMTLVSQYGPLGSHRAVFYASELVLAITSLHAAGIVHRNLDPQNILLDSEGHVVISGFGCANMTSSTECQGCMDQFDGTVSGYQAPEIILRWAHDTSVDCWSFGMLLYFMHFGTNPFGKNDLVEDSAMKLCNRILHSPISAESLRLISPMARDLILKCLERNPAIRWNMDKIKTHPYFGLIDWHEVSSKCVEVPPFVPPAPNIKKPAETRNRRMSLNPMSNDVSRRPISDNRNVGLADLVSEPPSLPELFKPALKSGIPTPIPEEDDALEFQGVHDAQGDVVSETNHEDVIARTSSFWDRLDREERGSIVSATSAEFGGCNKDASGKVPKLRKHRSAINAHHRLFSLSTTSFHSKLRKKPRSTGTLRQAKPAEVIENLPLGVHQIGSGIGFTYNLPEVVVSKLSVSSLTPATCHNLFGGGLSALTLGLGLGKAKAKQVSAPPALDLPGQQLPGGENDAHWPDGDSALPQREEVGTGTFVRDMYRTPSWLLSPPDSLPSPLALVNSTSDSPPLSDSTEPLSPETLVDETESVNILIPKSLGLECDFPDGTPDSTLRLVPPSKRSSFLASREEYLFGEVSTA